MALVRAEPALPLAALRIVVPAMILTTAEVRHAVSLASEPAALRLVPEGLGWFVRLVPIHPAVAAVVQAVCVFAALCAIAGVRARLALAVVTVAAFYLFALSQLSGGVWHDMHLLWMAALLAASPCDEALAFDRRGGPPPADSTRYGAPLTLARLQLAAVYFFPGLHKLLTSGLAWALSDNLRNTLWWKWAEHGVMPPPGLRVDRLPGLLHAGGLFVMAFELGFPLLVLWPRARPWLALAGLAFHAMAGVFLLIPFVSLWTTYVVLVDPSPLARAVGRLGRAEGRGRDAPVARSQDATHVAIPSRAPPTTWPTWPTWLVGALLLVPIVIQGARGQTRAFPFACYPTFEWMLPTTMPDLLVEAEAPAGSAAPDGGAPEAVEVPLGRDAPPHRSQRGWAAIWSLIGVTSPVDPRRLRAFLVAVARSEPARSRLAHASRVRFVHVERSVVPEERDAPPSRREVLAEMPWP